MKFPTTLLALALLTVPALSTPAQAAPPQAAPAPAAPELAAAAAPAAVTVARYSFDQGVSAQGTVVENTGRGTRLQVRAAAGGQVRAVPARTGRFVAFPVRCAATATAANCRRALLQGTNDADLNPGTNPFRFGASVLIAKSQIKNSSNVMQKGVVSAESQWKLQIGEAKGRAQCVIVGRGSAQPYIVRSTISVVDGRWHQVTCMRTATGLYIFVDGVRHGVVAVPATVSISNTRPLRLGAPNLALDSDSFNGYLDDVFVVRG
jgi:hypothetical protein